MAGGTTRLRRGVFTSTQSSAHRRETDARDHGRPDEQLQLAGFWVGDGLYAIDIMRIKEVIQAGPHPVRRVPYAPAIIEGVIQLRGVVIPVVDLRKRFGVQPDPQHARLNKLIIVSVRGRIVGLKVDRVYGELRMPGDALRPAPSMLRPPLDAGGEEPPDFFTGVCRVAQEMVFVVRLETVIDPRYASMAMVAAPAVAVAAAAGVPPPLPGAGEPERAAAEAAPEPVPVAVAPARPRASVRSPSGPDRRGGR